VPNPTNQLASFKYVTKLNNVASHFCFNLLIYFFAATVTPLMLHYISLPRPTQLSIRLWLLNATVNGRKAHLVLIDCKKCCLKYSLTEDELWWLNSLLRKNDSIGQRLDCGPAHSGHKSAKTDDTDDLTVTVITAGTAAC